MGDRRPSDELPDERERRGTERNEGILDKENRRGAMRGGVRGRIALSGIFTGIRDGIVACPVPMQS